MNKESFLFLAGCMFPLLPCLADEYPRDQSQDSLKTIALQEVVITRRLNPLNEQARVDLAIKPVNSSQEVLRLVPGLFIAQHAGGGKAEQLFLRGFDLDHGTDIHITVDGIPVNMPSHAHGQGYADLHFLQPECIERIDFGKGPYDMTKGNLATAGYVAFRTKDRMANEASVEWGQYGTRRMRFAYSLLDDTRNNLYVSTALLRTDGYFDAPQDFYRLNLLSKYTHRSEDARFSVMLSHFSSTWDASGQIPERAVQTGIIGRFGALDDTEGGATSRTNLTMTYQRSLDEHTEFEGTAWLSYYDFDLYSNFTFYLNDPVNGDQIEQREHRMLSGANGECRETFRVGQEQWQLRTGAGFRYDRVNDLALYHTRSRQRIGTFALGDVDESNLYGYAGLNMEWGRWLLQPSLRLDAFHWGYADRLQEEYVNRERSKCVFSPKLNISYRVNDRWQFLLKLGKGFHSNDARMTVTEKKGRVLPAAYGADLGVVWRPLPVLMFNATCWYLRMQQELVYVGDEAVVEPSGRTRRLGIDLGMRWQLGEHFYGQADYTYSHARSMDEPKGQDYVPLAPVHTLMAGLTYRKGGLSAGVNYRYLSDRPANEDNTLMARGYGVTDLNVAYTHKRLTLGLVVENLFDVSWNEAQFATETRLADEATPVTEIHFTPGTPFNARGFVTLRF